MPSKMDSPSGRRWLRKMQRDLKCFQPNRRELSFEALLQAPFEDQIIERLFLNLHLEVCEFIQQGFGEERLSDNQQSPWSADYSAEFLQLVAQLARPGIDSSRWDSLLEERTERCALLQGVMLKALETNVFSSLLFGATAAHTNLLAAEDSSLINMEGFKRTHLRAETNRLYLQSGDGMPHLFWKEVDRATIQIMRLLLPVYSHIGHSRDGDRRGSAKQQVTTYQALHDLVAHAAWVSIAIRISPKIARWEWVKPGELYKFEQISIDSPKQQDEERLSHGDSPCQRVMICAAPMITLHGSGTDGFSEGRVKYTIMMPRVVCYLGHGLDMEDQKAIVPLHRHLRRARCSSRYNRASILRWTFWFLVKVYLAFLVLVAMNSLFGWELELHRGNVLGSSHLAGFERLKLAVARLGRLAEAPPAATSTSLPKAQGAEGEETSA